MSEEGFVPPPQPKQESPPKGSLQQGVKSPDDSADSSTNIASLNVTIESKSAENKFRIFVIAGIIIIVLIYTAVAIIFLKNKSLKQAIRNRMASTIPTFSPSPTPTFSPELIVIENGNVAYKQFNKPSKIIIDKKTIPDVGITGFSSVTVSPNSKFLCLTSIPPSPKPAIYISDIDGKNLKKISSDKKNCLWKADSKTIFYEGKATRFSRSDIFKYNLETSEETNLTAAALVNTSTNFSLVGLSSDESKVICTYTTQQEENLSCEVELDTNTFQTL
jgi:hypothetical protein